MGNAAATGIASSNTNNNNNNTTTTTTTTSSSNNDNIDTALATMAGLRINYRQWREGDSEGIDQYQAHVAAASNNNNNNTLNVQTTSTNNNNTTLTLQNTTNIESRPRANSDNAILLDPSGTSSSRPTTPLIRPSSTAPRSTGGVFPPEIRPPPWASTRSGEPGNELQRLVHAVSELLVGPPFIIPPPVPVPVATTTSTTSNNNNDTPTKTSSNSSFFLDSTKDSSSPIPTSNNNNKDSTTTVIKQQPTAVVNHLFLPVCDKIDEFLRGMPSWYLEIPANEVASHIRILLDSRRFVAEKRESSVSVLVHQHHNSTTREVVPSMYVVVVVARDQRQLLDAITRCVSIRASIMEATIATTRDGFALDRFVVLDQAGTIDPHVSELSLLAHALKTDIDAVLANLPPVENGNTPAMNATTITNTIPPSTPQQQQQQYGLHPRSLTLDDEVSSQQQQQDSPKSNDYYYDNNFTSTPTHHHHHHSSMISTSNSPSESKLLNNNAISSSSSSGGTKSITNNRHNQLPPLNPTSSNNINPNTIMTTTTTTSSKTTPATTTTTPERRRPRNSSLSNKKKPSWEIPFQDVRLVRLLGQGISGNVFLAEFQGKRVAAKVLRRRSDQEEAFLLKSVVDDFNNELTLVSRLNHPNVVKFLGAASRPPRFLTLYELCEGGNLSNLIPQKTRKYSFFQVAIEAATGLAYIHAHNIIHRDVKPENLLLDAQGRVKVTDFGLSRLVEKDGEALTAETGSYKYMAPETTLGQQYSFPIDVYSYGIVLGALVAKKFPFMDYTPVQAAMATSKGVRPTLPKRGVPKGLLERVIQPCWDGNPSNRPSFDMVIAILNTIRDSLSKSEKGVWDYQSSNNNNTTTMAATSSVITTSSTL
jgi:tRNA A-37 threonylcarbamoyl transferase component Bud32